MADSLCRIVPEGMVVVEAGEVYRGGNREDTYPGHYAYIDRFYVDRFEVTTSDYKRCVENNVCSPTGYEKL